MKWPEKSILPNFGELFAKNALRRKNTLYVSAPNSVPSDNCLVTCNVVRGAICHVKCGKSAGSDDHKGENITHVSPRLQVLLAVCFAFMLVYQHLPGTLFLVDLAPIPKEKCGSITNSDNYHHIAIATVMSKLLERILMLKYKETFFVQTFSLASRKSTAQRLPNMR